MAHRGQERALGVVGRLGRGARLLRILKQPCVLQRDTDIGGDGGEQAFVVGVVHALCARALHADRSLRRAAHQNRHAEVRQRLLADDGGAELEAQPVLLPVDGEGLARLDDPARQALAVLERHELVAVLVGELDDAGSPVE